MTIMKDAEEKGVGEEGNVIDCDFEDDDDGNTLDRIVSIIPAGRGQFFNNTHTKSLIARP